jgi:hypothetical protein
MNTAATQMVSIQGPKDENYRDVYINISRVAFTPWDIRIVAGQMVEGATISEQQARDMVALVMAPQHAKALYAAWGDAIRQYETAFGQIPDLTESIQKLTAPKKP